MTTTTPTQTPITILPAPLIELPEADAPEAADKPKDTTPLAPPEQINNADLLGVETDAFNAILEQPATLLLGEMWGEKDRRNTQDGDWKPLTLTWAEWIVGGPGDKNIAPWGFSRHPVGKDKAGASIVLGSSIGQARTKKAMDTMYALGLDIDAGYPLDAMLDKLEKLGLFCLVYTTHSHGRAGLQIKHDDVIRKLKIKPSELTVEKVKEYLRLHSKNRYEDDFIDAVTIKQLKKQTKEGVVVDLGTPKLDKYRLIFPLAAPVKLIDLAGTQAEALALWESKVMGLAVETLGVHVDVSCTDPSRLFYTPRHPATAGDDWYCAVVRGDPLRFEDVPVVKKSSYTSNRKSAALNPFELAGGAGDTDKPPQCWAPSGASLNDWHCKAKDRFQMADLLEDLCADRVRNVGGESQGHIHIECPFEGEHTSEGGTATMAVNALDSQNGFWTIFCHHDACQGRHKLEFLEEALRQNWFNESELFGDTVYMRDGPDEDDDDDDLLEVPKDRAGRATYRAASVRDDLLELVAGFDADTSDAAIRDVIRQAIDAKADKTTQARLKEAVTGKTAIGAKAFNDLWTGEAKKARQKQKPKGDAGRDIGACHVKADFSDQLDYARGRIVGANEVRPRLFQFGGAYSTADAVRHRIRTIEDRDAMHYVLQDVTRWDADVKIGDDWDVRKVPPPESVVRTLYKDHNFADTLPELLAVPSTPFFDAEGCLVDEDGYHAGARVYLAKGDLVLPGVSREPSDDEVAEAKRLLVEEVLADFPLGGMDRAKIVGTLTGENPDAAHAVTHAVAFTLLPFCRDLIAGPTPGHMYTKPGPGTGASLLVDVLTTIASGSPAPAMTLPTRAEEVEKTLSAVLAEGAPVVFFDNINKSIDSGGLASAMTAPLYQARILGKTQTVLVPVRAVWAFTANNIEATPEVLRRVVLIPLNAGVPDPEQRKPENGWLHPNIRHWVTANRPALVWACLTIIQNWVAGGMVQQKAVSLASYEDWAGVMGGILAAAGFHGFLGGQAEERAKATDATEDGMVQLVRLMGAYPDGTVFRPGGARDFEDRRTVSVMDLLNGVERHGELGKTDEDPIQISGWGYKDFDGRYTASGRIGRGLKFLARKPHQIDGQMLTFTELIDKRAGVSVYRMGKTTVQ